MTSTNCNGNEELPPRTKYLKHTLYLTLEEMYKGTVRKLAINKNIVCKKCRGIGSRTIKPQDYDTCEQCSGLGTKTVIIRRGPNLDILEEITRDCYMCWGKGEAIIKDNRCPTCHGQKVVDEQSVLTVNVRAGARHGQKIIYKGEGTQEPNMRPGDVIVVLEALDHHTFTRDGDDLVMTMRLDLVESLCGFQKLVTTLDKRRLAINSPCGKVIAHEDIKYVAGEGMPLFRQPSKKGNLIITFEVNVPDRIRGRLVNKIEQCLPQRKQLEIPMDAIDCNMMDLAPMVYNDKDDRDIYDQNEENCAQEQHYGQHYGQYEQYDPENQDEHGFVEDEQYDHQAYYHDENSYEVQENYEHPSEYDQHYNYQGYDSHNNFQQEEFYQQEDDDSLESYDATQQYRFTDYSNISNNVHTKMFQQEA